MTHNYDMKSDYKRRVLDTQDNHKSRILDTQDIRSTLEDKKPIP